MLEGREVEVVFPLVPSDLVGQVHLLLPAYYPLLYVHLVLHLQLARLEHQGVRRLSLFKDYRVQKFKLRKVLAFLLDFVEEIYVVAFVVLPGLLALALAKADQFLIKGDLGVNFVLDGGALGARAAGFEVEEVMVLDGGFGARNQLVQVLILFHDIIILSCAWFGYAKLLASSAVYKLS